MGLIVTREPTIVKVNVRNLAVGGEGVGEVTWQSDGNQDLLGITAFVPFSAVGEQVRAQVSQRKGRYIRGTMIEVEQYSKERLSPECEYFEHCGGCELQHIRYQEQLRSKGEMLKGALRAAGLGLDVVDRLKEVLPSKPYGYRRRLSLHVDSGGRVGLYRNSSRSVVAIDNCSVATSKINEALRKIQSFGRDVAGQITSILLEEDSSGLVVVLKSPIALSAVERREVLKAAKNYFTNVSLMIAEKEVDGFGRRILELPLSKSGHIKLRVPAGSFTQVNWEINLQLIEDVLRFSRAHERVEIFDLYSGAGNFSIPLARAGAKVQAVECDSTLISFGRENSKRYSLERRLDFVDMSVEKFLKLSGNSKSVQSIIADPPRSGLGKLTSEIRCGEQLQLISCHLPSFVRDLRNLLEVGWQIENIKPYDMFSQTSYLEILGVFRRG